MSEIPRIVALLRHEAIEKQIAAAIILGELRAKGPEVEGALAVLCESGNSVLQRHALDALARVGSKRVAERLFPLLQSPSADVREAAVRALAAAGESVVPKIRARREQASADERRALDAVLGALGGGRAFTTLLEGLSSADAEAGKAAALALRARLKEASAQERKDYLGELQAYLKAQVKAKAPAAALGAALKIVGYLEDDRAVATLLVYAADPDQAPAVRQEAIIALRFALSKSRKDASKVVDVLLDAASHEDRTLAQTALHTLGARTLSQEHERRLDKLVTHPDLERARFVIEHLGRQGGADAAKLLVRVLVAGDRRRAEMAATALSGNDAAHAHLGRALLELRARDRAWMIRGILQKNAAKVPPAVRAQLLERAVALLGSGEHGWEAPWEVAREGDPAGAATALRTLAAKLRKSDEERALTVLRLLARGEHVADEDRYALAAIELGRGSHDTHPLTRAKDPALLALTVLAERGFDVGAALRKDKKVELEALFYVGFHFAEAHHPLGAELLGDVVKKGGRTKLARMAKNKLQLSGEA